MHSSLREIEVNENEVDELFNKLIEIICVGACGENFKLLKFSMQVNSIT